VIIIANFTNHTLDILKLKYILYSVVEGRPLLAVDFSAFSAFQILLACVDFLKWFNWFVSSQENTQNALVKYQFMVKYVNVLRLLYSHIFKNMVLYFNKPIYSTVLQQLSSHAYMIKSRYNLYKQKIINVKRNRTVNMYIQPSQIIEMLG
jgi:hypothetical protein